MPPTLPHLVKGMQGEDIAAEFLKNKGWRIAERNWRCHRGEIDIIAWDTDNILVFVEVKTRSSESFGGPEGAITARKQKLLARTAGLYMESIDYGWEIRFDVIGIIIRSGRVLDLRHAADAFFPA